MIKLLVIKIIIYNIRYIIEFIFDFSFIINGGRAPKTE